MHHRRTTHPAGRALDPGLLCSLLEAVEAGLDPDLVADTDRPGAGHGHLAIAVRGADAVSVEVAIRELDAADVVGALVGLEAPDHWSAFGLVCEGRAWSVATADDRWPPAAALGAVPHRVRVGVLLDRRGSTVVGLRRPGSDFEPRAGGDAPLGRVPDACRRVLGLATPPPEADPAELWSLWWAERVLGEAIRRPGRLTWPEAVGLHPGVTILSNGVPRVDRQTDDEHTHDRHLEAGRRRVAGLGWNELRRRAADRPLGGLAVRPQAADWMDAGMFSREVLDGFAPLASILAELELVVSPAVLGALEQSMERFRAT